MAPRQVVIQVSDLTPRMLERFVQLTPRSLGQKQEVAGGYNYCPYCGRRAREIDEKNERIKFLEAEIISFYEKCLSVGSLPGNIVTNR